MEHSDILLNALAQETDELKQMNIISGWIELHVATFNINKPKAFAKITSQLYESDENAIAQVSKFGADFNRVLSSLLANFSV
ncbi:hypothetical protein AMS59_20870 [Lysinibacillus sp. FJAT-14745]|uniref:hypothetical protein n=1 Tax=Lysinibacillus sp. FJAT-14745 TaxID=1704289 RepID=UPI0006ABB879|nr:hypothetical protein [Lysinibacillus sp. FJAT-14745]KOP70276.1 hypothetical protein AMS59_20870 [Lysinibacillus sp. FJAT-14745]